MKCSRCGTEGEGNFCPSCGANLVRRACSSCGAQVSAGSRFCTSCGTSLQAQAEEAAVGDEAAKGDKRGDVAWWIAGGLLVVVLVLVAFPRGDGEEPAQPGPAAPVEALGPAPGVDLSTMTPREAADRLYNRVMEGVSVGDTAEVESFLPMAIDAYELARPLDADGHFHLSLLQRLAGDYERARATAEAALQEHPDHLLNLSAAAEAAVELGDTAAARGYYAHLAEVFDDEAQRGLPEYEEHSPLMASILSDALDFLEDHPEG